VCGVTNKTTKQQRHSAYDWPVPVATQDPVMGAARICRLGEVDIEAGVGQAVVGPPVIMTAMAVAGLGGMIGVAEERDDKKKRVAGSEG
jgi:hypothetical protein